jgi:hypothetical protein
MLYQLSYASPNSRAPCPQNGRITIAKVTTKSSLIEGAVAANPGAIIPRLMRVVNGTLHAQAD